MSRNRMTRRPMFTVFTPTYNRKHTLHRVYESLVRQTCTDFEWLVVDDGSIDGTRQLVDFWKHQAPFPIRYYYQQNGGKHRAFNKAVLKAKGYLFLCLDSDDACLPQTLEKFKTHWKAISEEKREEFSGIIVHCLDSCGKLIGNRFPRDCMDLRPAEMNAKFHIRGEKWGLYRTDVLRRYPYPEFEGERFIPEGVVWNRIGNDYQIRYVNEALRIYYKSSRGLDARSRKIRIQNPRGARLYYREALMQPYRWLPRMKHRLNFIAFSLHTRIPPARLCEESDCYFTTMLFLPLGYLVYVLDKKIS
ncbi:MAG: glycosyltransferase family 2 protein [Deltaproteobacteria bacterium]|nr:glycosyltransferase family 2 protein [Deltaproteobacteria bacterium]